MASRRPGPRPRAAHRSLTAGLWVLGLVVLVALAAAWVSVTRTRPSYDAYGWLVWGRETLVGHLNTDGAPSWKPLSYLFTLPYALFGPQLRLWTITSSAGGVAMIVFAARVAYRLTVPLDRPAARRWPGLVAGAFAGVSTVGLGGLAHQVLIANSDPLVVALCLVAVDAHLCRRPRLAFIALVLASLGRPEVWPFTGLYAVWTWRRVPNARWLSVAGIALIPAAWFVIPALTAHTWLISGTLALQSPDAVHGSKFLGVLSRFVAIYELPMQCAVVAAMAIAALRRQWSAIGLAAAAALWVLIEVAFAYHGWPASPRYLLEAAAVLVALAGGGVGWTLEAMADRRWWALLAGPVGLAALVVALVPVGHNRVIKFDHQLGFAKRAAIRMDRLQMVIAAVGGARQVERCGHPVTFVGYQSDLAWHLGLNVGKVGYKPGREIRHGYPIVLFQPHELGWELRPIHTHRNQARLCARMRVDFGFGRAGLRAVAPPGFGPIPPVGPPARHRRPPVRHHPARHAGRGGHRPGRHARHAGRGGHRPGRHARHAGRGGHRPGRHARHPVRGRHRPGRHGSHRGGGRRPQGRSSRNLKPA